MSVHRCTYNDDGRYDGQTIISDGYHELTSDYNRNKRPANVRNVLENNLHLYVSCRRRRLALL